MSAYFECENINYSPSTVLWISGTHSVCGTEALYPADENLPLTSNALPTGTNILLPCQVNILRLRMPRSEEHWVCQQLQRHIRSRGSDVMNGTVPQWIHNIMALLGKWQRVGGRA